MLFNLFLSLVAVYLLLIAGMVIFQRHLMYHPSPTWIAEPRELENVYAVTYPTADGLNLTSWYAPPQEGRPVFVMFHGNTGNISDRAYKMQHFTMEGYGFLLAEYRGFGSNAGKPSEQGFYNDGRAAIDWLMKTQHIPESRIIIYGESIGNGTATEMAIEYKGIKALVLEAPFTSAANEAGDVYRWLGPFKHLVFDKFDNISKAPQLTAPTLVLQGSRDEVIPFTHGKALFDAVGSKVKNYVPLEGGGHNNLSDYKLFENIDLFLNGLK